LFYGAITAAGTARAVRIAAVVAVICRSTS
jgi:hypothetical protein